MTPEQKQSELDRYRAILMATLDYLEARFGGSMVYDQYDLFMEHFRKERLKLEKYLERRRLDRLQQAFRGLAKGLQNSLNLEFADYIKEKTGYELDLYEDLRQRVGAIVAKNKIQSKKELNDVGAMLIYYQQTAPDGEEARLLKSLLTTYVQETSKSSRTRKERSEVISRVEKDGIVEATVRFSTGPAPKHYDEKWADAPDGKCKLCVQQWSNGKQASTTVSIHFANGSSGAVYGVSVLTSEINAWWKDGSTIVIEAPKVGTNNLQHKEVRSFNEVITIEYREQ